LLEAVDRVGEPRAPGLVELCEDIVEDEHGIARARLLAQNLG
jgi:hypothetical protein